MNAKLSILDLAMLPEGGTPADALQASVVSARLAEQLGYVRYWFSEHHNMPSIVSSTPALLVAHIAAHTERIRVGSGGVMLPNHSPLLIAEQFGTLEALYPGRIDLGVGRAPGTDYATVRALRRDMAAAERFPQDVVELQALLGPVQPGQTVQAVPGAGTNVPVYILGSSLFGAKLAAMLGLPYGFASHFAPDSLLDAIAIYRDEFEPSDQLAKPYLIAGFNVFAMDDPEEAQRRYQANLVRRARMFVQDGASGISDDDLLASAAGQRAWHMARYSAVGDAAQVADALERFVALTGADEVMVVTSGDDPEMRLRSYELLAQAAGMAPAHAESLPG